MPRVARESNNTTYFHVLVQGINKSYIFEERMDILYYIKQMYEIKEEVGVNIVAYCIMNNHAHLLLNVENTNMLSKYMHKLNTKYAVYYNKIHNRVGYVFRDRYKSEGIYNERHLYNCIKYIYDNPVKAKICDNPWEYQYSNYKRYNYITQNSENTEDFIDINKEYKDLRKAQKENKINNIIENFLEEWQIRQEDLKHDKQKLKELIFMIRQEENVSIRWIGNKLGIHREIIRNLLK